MADVSRSAVDAGRAPSSGRDPRTDRGQIFLVAALVLAVLFVGLALLLNTAIYTENLATRNTDPGTDPSISYRHVAEEAAVGVMVRENANHTDLPYADVEDRYVRGVDEWSNAAGLHAARYARSANVTVDSAVHGTRFEQTDLNRNFTNESGTVTDWQVEDGVDVRDVQFTVERGSLEELSDDPFELSLESSSDPTTSWSVVVYSPSASEVGVAVSNDSATATCVATVGSHAVVDVSTGHINDTACPAIGETLDLDGEDVDVRFRNGDEAVGTYHLVVDSGVSLGADEDHVDNEVDGSPFVTAVVYEADVTITYESTDVAYRTTVRIAPEEIR
ncbi:DUF7261 family protein [Salinigranum sp. GCM10025319]|uniref:DUF7261 family protein n=1 Tax=Salinigranum sp. GCM10025319 TaxID=3252687 RepID=UPI0036229159